MAKRQAWSVVVLLALILGVLAWPGLTATATQIARCGGFGHVVATYWDDAGVQHWECR